MRKGARRRRELCWWWTRACQDANAQQQHSYRRAVCSLSFSGPWHSQPLTTTDVHHRPLRHLLYSYAAPDEKAPANTLFVPAFHLQSTHSQEGEQVVLRLVRSGGRGGATIGSIAVDGSGRWRLSPRRVLSQRDARTPAPAPAGEKLVFQPWGSEYCAGCWPYPEGPNVSFYGDRGGGWGLDGWGIAGARGALRRDGAGGGVVQRGVRG